MNFIDLDYLVFNIEVVFRSGSFCDVALLCSRARGVTFCATWPAS